MKRRYRSSLVRFRGSFRLERLSKSNLDRVWLTISPFILRLTPDLRVFGPLLNGQESLPSVSTSSAVSRHLSASAPALPPFRFQPCRLPSCPPQSTSPQLFCPSAFPSKVTLLLTTFRLRLESFAPLPRSPIPRVWLPSRWRPLPYP
jgi:hypothetical protein